MKTRYLLRCHGLGGVIPEVGISGIQVGFGTSRPVYGFFIVDWDETGDFSVNYDQTGGSGDEIYPNPDF